MPDEVKLEPCPELVERVARLAWLLRRNLEDEDRRMALENCNRLICLLETGETPDDLDTLRAVYRTISARLIDGSGEDGNPPISERVALLGAIEATRPTAATDDVVKTLTMAEQFLDKANALACGEYRSNVQILANRLAEVRDYCRAAIANARSGSAHHPNRRLGLGD